jgi:hypothetical protein
MCLDRTPLLTNQTIEPTQVAAFDQFFDEPTGTEARRYGIAVDHKFTMALYGGLDFSAREQRVPRRTPPKGEWDERAYRAYVDWTVNPRIAATLAYQLEEFENAKRTPGVPETTTTHFVEAGLRFFDFAGVFSHVEAMYINQKAVASFLAPPSIQNQFVQCRRRLSITQAFRYFGNRVEKRVR